MEIHPNEEQNNETSARFVNFSIREYVAEIRKKDWKKCWPFGSLCDPNKLDEVSASEFQESTFLSSRNRPRDNDASNHTPVHTETPNYLNASRQIDDDICKTVYNGSLEQTSSKVNIGQCQNGKSVDEGAEIGNSVASNNDHEPGRNQTRRKPQKFLLLSDILRELAGPSGEFHVRCDITNADNVNARFTTENENESDDNVTLGTLFRKQKGLEVTPALKNKKMKMIRVEQDKGSKPGFKDCHGKTRIADVDIQTNAKRKKTSPEFRPNKDALITLEGSSKSNGYVEAVNEDSEMEAVLLLARHFKEAEKYPFKHGAKRAQPVQITNQSAEPGPGQLFTNVKILNKNTEPGCACVQKKIRESSTHKDPVLLYANTHKNLNKEKLADALFSVSVACQPQTEIYMMTACTINRNPADFTMPNAGNKFMRRG